MSGRRHEAVSRIGCAWCGKAITFVSPGARRLMLQRPEHARLHDACRQRMMSVCDTQPLADGLPAGRAAR